MTLELPRPVATYLAAEKAKDTDLLISGFAEDALVHDESVETDSIEKTLDDQVRRRFAEIINRAVEDRTVWPGIARRVER